MEDAQILQLLRQGHPDGLEVLSATYRERLVGYASRLLGNRHEAEDVAQEVLLRAPRARDLDRESALAGWLYSVSYRLVVDRLRDRTKARRLLPPLGRVRDEVEAPSGEVDSRDEWARVERFLHGLPEPYHTALVLRYLEGREFSEIATAMGTIERTARTWVGRGLTRLRERLRPTP